MLSAFLDHLPQLLLAWSIQLMGVTSPGPGVAFILGVAMRNGRGSAVMSCVGIGSAAMVLALGTVLGLAALLSSMSYGVQILRWAGAAYLAWLAYQSFKTAIILPPLTLSSEEPVRDVMKAGFLMQLLNPKAIFFWVAVAAAGGVGTAPWPVVGVFVLGAGFISFAGHGTYALLLSSSPARLAYTRARRWVEAGLGAIFAGFSLRLVLERG